jgi:hypothetical protein
VKSRVRGEKREADPIDSWGRPMTLGKNQASALSGTAGTWARASEERLADNNVEKVPLAAGADSNRQGHLERGDELKER